eukprot:TRINITY_DN147_c0_g2_i1.p1 TRINITY_DN147_c0_g2~~TRINITY_DN147_c0_g2_i1.p1  ORF type:complete len:121 (-),score=47.19 TRINITY_DN147_c0_g2_i1:221-583(-)
MAENRTIYVGGLDENITPEILKSVFIAFGEIVEVTVPLSPGDQKSKGFGFVEFEFDEDALAAVDNMHLGELYGKTLKVNISKQQTTNIKNRAIWENETDEYFSVNEQDDNQNEDSLMKNT